MSRICCQPEAPTSRAASSCEGGTVVNAPPKSNIEKAVPRQMLTTMIDRSGQLNSHGIAALPRSPLRVPCFVSRKAIHRNATTEPGMIQARITRISTALRSGPRQARRVQARMKPRTA